MNLKRVLLIAALLPSLHARADHPVPADSPDAYYEGRVATGEDHSVAMGFPGIVLHLHVRAARVRAEVDVSGNAYFDLSVDGGPQRLIRLGEADHSIELLASDTPGEHRINLTRRTESWQGQCRVRGFRLDDAGELLSMSRPGVSLVFIGDSITCGAGTEISPTGQMSDPVRSNGRNSFGRLIADRLGAECFLVSYGGRGVFRDWQGIRAIANAPVFYERTLPDDPTSRWDFSKNVPSVVCLCLGTNDFNQGIPDENEFVNAYVEFVRKIQRDAPNATVLLVDSPMTIDGVSPRHTTAVAYIEEVVQALRSPLVRHVRLMHVPGVPGDGHPTAADHVTIADFLLPYFNEALAKTPKS